MHDGLNGLAAPIAALSETEAALGREMLHPLPSFNCGRLARRFKRAVFAPGTQLVNVAIRTWCVAFRVAEKRGVTLGYMRRLRDIPSYGPDFRVATRFLFSAVPVNRLSGQLSGVRGLVNSEWDRVRVYKRDLASER
jgi:hypothetical protein